MTNRDSTRGTTRGVMGAGEEAGRGVMDYQMFSTIFRKRRK